MSRKSRIVTAAGLMAAAGLFASTQASGSVVIGSWTAGNTNDGWFNWTHASQNGGNPGALGLTYLPPPKYTFGVDGAVPGDPTGDSLILTNGGYQQNLAVKLEYETGDMAAFYANNAIQVQITYPSYAATGSTSGYSQLYQLALNMPGGWGFTGLTASPVPGSNVYYYNGAAQRTVTLTLSYAAALATVEANGYGPSNPGYAEFIFSTNNGSGAPTYMYFDQVSLVTVPEPASLGLLGLAAAGLFARRRAR